MAHPRWLRYADLWIAVLVVMAWWPLTFGVNSLSAGDTLDCWLPWRAFITASLRDGAFPLWNPYQQMGYPVYADLQGPAWYVESLALGGTIGHTVYTLQALFLAYVMVGAWGMRRLVLRLGSGALPAFLMGSTWALSGFLTAHAQHFFSVISAAWWPWLLWSWLGLLERPGWRPVLRTSLFAALLLAGGNHTFLLIGSYLLLALFVQRVWRPQGVPRSRLLAHAAAVVPVTVSMALGVFLAWWRAAPIMDRSGGLAIERALENPFTLKALASYVLPAITAARPEALGTDPAMANAFVGLTVLGLALVGLGGRLRGPLAVIAGFGAVAFMASFGDLTPVHGLLWRWVPGLDLFRFPSYYQFFAMLALLPLGARGLENWTAVVQQRPWWIMGTIGTLVLFAGWSTWVAFGLEPASTPEMVVGWTATLAGLPYASKLLIPLACSLLALAALLMVMHRGRAPAGLLVALFLLDLLPAHQLSLGTALGPQHPAAVQARLDALPEGPLAPPPDPMGESQDGSEQLRYLWRNTQGLVGLPTHDGFNSFWPKDHLALEREHPELLLAMKAVPFLYLSDTLVPGDHPSLATGPLPAGVVVPDQWNAGFHDIRSGESGAITWEAFRHASFRVSTRCPAPRFLLVQQNHLPGWEVLVDGASAPVHRVNVAAFGVVVPAGEHDVEVRYVDPFVKPVLVVQLLALFVGMLLLAWCSGACRMWWLSGWMLLLGLVSWSLLGHRPLQERVANDIEMVQEELARSRNAAVLFHMDRPALLRRSSTRGPTTVVPWGTEAWVSLEKVLRQGRPDTLLWAWAGTGEDRLARVVLADRFASRDVLVGGPAAGLVRWSGRIPERLPGRERGGYLEDDGLVLREGDLPWSPAVEIPTAELGPADRLLVVDLQHRGVRDAGPRVAFERRSQGRVTGYDTQELPVDTMLRTAHFPWDLAEVAPGDDTLRVYVWNTSATPFTLEGLRIRTFP